MFSLVGKGVLGSEHYSYTIVENKKDARTITPLSVLTLSTSLRGKDDLNIDVMDFTLLDIVKRKPTVEDNIEQTTAALQTRNFVYLVKATDTEGTRISTLADIHLPGQLSGQENLYYKCNFINLCLIKKSVDPVKLNDAISHWWMVDTSHVFYSTYMTIVREEKAVITTAVQTSCDIVVDVELVCLEEELSNIATLYEAGKELPKYKETGHSKPFTIPSGSTLAYQYTKIQINEAGKISANLLGFSVTDVQHTLTSTATGTQTRPMDSRGEDCALPVLELRGNNEYRFVEENLKKILTRPEVRGLPVCVVSIAGAFRTGKTFMLNFFKKFLEGKPEPTWLTNPSEVARNCEFFQWRGGEDAHTMGLHMWSKPFVVELTSSDKVAVLLMDTQGTFDHHSSNQSTATIFALSTLVSSLQIYNISLRIGEDALRHLEYFTEYGKLAVKNNIGKPFQSLMFLVRDHPKSSHLWGNMTGKLLGGQKAPDYGLDAGEKYLQQKVFKIDARQSAENRQVRDGINSMFQSLSCFLLPRPGCQIMDGFPFDYNDPMSDASNHEFLTHVQDLVYNVLSSNHLVLKEQNGTQLTTETYLVAFRQISNIFTSGEMPPIKTVVEANADASYAVAASNSKDMFSYELQQFASQKKIDMVLANNELTNKIQELESKAIDVFKQSPRFGGEKLYKVHLETLKEELKKIAARHQSDMADIPTEYEAKQNCKTAVSRCMELFNTSLQEFVETKQACSTLERAEISEFYQTHFVDVCDEFKNQPKIGNTSIWDPFLKDLQKQLQRAWKPANDKLSEIPTAREARQSQEIAQRDAENYFKTGMSRVVDSELAKDETNLTDFMRNAENLKQNTKSKFMQREKLGGDALTETYLRYLVTSLDEEIKESREIVEKRAKQDASNLEAYNYCIHQFTSAMNEFLYKQAEEDTLEKDSIDNKYDRVKAEWSFRLTTYNGPNIQMQQKYRQRFDEACKQKYGEVCYELRDKPTRRELEENNQRAVEECYQLYKEEIKRFIRIQINKGVYNPFEVERNHEAIRDNALKEFRGQILLGSDQIQRECQRRLKEKIARCYKDQYQELSSSACTVEDAKQRNSKLQSQCFIEYLKEMRREAHYNWQKRWFWNRYKSWFEKKHPGISRKCLDQFNAGRTGSYDFSLSERNSLHRKMNAKYMDFTEKEDRWFNLSDGQAMRYSRGEYELSDEETS